MHHFVLFISVSLIHIVDTLFQSKLEYFLPVEVSDAQWFSTSADIFFFFTSLFITLVLIWHCLETLLVGTAAGVLLARIGQRTGMQLEPDHAHDCFNHQDRSGIKC